MDKEDLVLTTRVVRRFLANFCVQFTKDKHLRKKIRDWIENRHFEVGYLEIDKKIPPKACENINSFTNEDFLALNFAKEQDLKITQENIQIASSSKISKPYFISSSKALSLDRLISGGGAK